MGYLFHEKIGSVDRLSFDLQPLSYFFGSPFGLFVKRTFSTDGEVQEQIAVFADNIGKHMDDLGGFFISAPKVVIPATDAGFVLLSCEFKSYSRDREPQSENPFVPVLRDIAGVADGKGAKLLLDGKKIFGSKKKAVEEGKGPFQIKQYKMGPVDGVAALETVVPADHGDSPYVLSTFSVQTGGLAKDIQFSYPIDPAFMPASWDFNAGSDNYQCDLILYNSRLEPEIYYKEGWQTSEIGLRELTGCVKSSDVISPFLCDLQKFPPLRNGIRGMIIKIRPMMRLFSLHRIFGLWIQIFKKTSDNLFRVFHYLAFPQDNHIPAEFAKFAPVSPVAADIAVKLLFPEAYPALWQ